MQQKVEAKIEHKEFGGAGGALGIMLSSHVLVFYLWAALAYHQGSLFDPRLLVDHIATGAMPTLSAAAIYFGFLSFELILAAVMPGVWVKGLPVPTENNVQHSYLCNGYTSWLLSLAAVAALHFSGVFELTLISDELGPILMVATIFSNLLAIGTYIVTIRAGKQTRMSGSAVYDFFMGAVLNPRWGRVDLKFFTEIRVSWLLLFLLTLSAAAKQYATIGHLSLSMIFMLTAHGLYTNACMKGEECIPTTWDVFYEKWGWMLIFWNLVGVPFVYCFNAYYIAVAQPVEPPLPVMVGLFAALFFAYYVWDTSQSQRNRFRMQQRGTFVVRKTFPQLPWGTLKDPKFLSTANGSTLLIDGWWAHARKIHYAADIVMAFTWALCCGFSGVLPYLYPAFFLVMILHRASRDEARCRSKYGADWDKYLSIVPKRFIPFVY